MGNENQGVSFESEVFSAIQELSGDLNGASKHPDQCSKNCPITFPSHSIFHETPAKRTAPHAAVQTSHRKEFVGPTRTQFLDKLESVADDTPISRKKRSRTALKAEPNDDEGGKDSFRFASRMTATRVVSTGVLAECSECHANIGTSISMTTASDAADRVQPHGVTAHP